MAMDRNEFYKKLLENYTLDNDKIKCNAKRMGKKRRVAPIYKITGVASAAAVMIIAGCVAFSVLNNDNPLTLSPYTDPEIAIARLQAAEDNFRNSNYKDEDDIEMYVSFAEPLSSNAVYMVFSAVNDLGEIDCKLLYAVDGKIANCVTGENSLSSEELVSGAKIVAPAEYFYSLTELKAVSLVELKTDDITDENFIPLSEKEAQAAETTVAITEATLPEEILLPSETTPEITTTQTDVPEVTTEITETSDVSPLTPYDNPLNDNYSIPSTAISAYFISNSDLLVLTDTSVELYHFTAESAPSIEKIYVDKPKISWSNAEYTSMFITGCDSTKLRTKLIYVNGANPTLSDISNIVVGGEITGITYSEKENAIIFKVTNDNTSKIIVATRKGEALENTEAVTYNGPVAALAYSAGTLYYSATDVEASATSLMSTDIATGENKLISTYPSTVKFTKSYRLDSVAVSVVNEAGVTETKIFNTADNSFRTVEVVGAVKFSAQNSNVFADDEKRYMITADGVVEISEKEASAYDIKPLGSEHFTFTIGESAVTINKK